MLLLYMLTVYENFPQFRIVRLSVLSLSISLCFCCKTLLSFFRIFYLIDAYKLVRLEVPSDQHEEKYSLFPLNFLPDILTPHELQIPQLQLQHNKISKPLASPGTYRLVQCIQHDDNRYTEIYAYHWLKPIPANSMAIDYYRNLLIVSEQPVTQKTSVLDVMKDITSLLGP